jgi:hypothetical protein
MGIGRAGIAGNGYTSLVWKGDGQWISDGQYLKHGYWPFFSILDCGMQNAHWKI